MFQIIKKYILWRWDRSNRYTPVIRYLKNRYKNSRITILEVGSGDYSMGLYDGYKVTGLDIRPPESSSYLTEFIQDSIITADIENSAYDVVIGVDLIEHIPKKNRSKTINNMINIARKELLLVYPSGESAKLQDSKLYEHYKRRVHPFHLWFDEHQKFGVPYDVEIIKILKDNPKVKSYEIKKITNIKKHYLYSKFLMTPNYLWFMLKNKLLRIYDFFYVRSLHSKDFYRTFLIVKLDES